MGSDSQAELCGREWGDRFDQESLIVIPPLVEKQKIGLLFGHGKGPFLCAQRYILR
jgi:hypothetical protein